MARIGDTVRPELGRADTSGILRGTMQGASALGQGIAALGAGVGAGIKERKQHEKDVTATISRLDLLKKSVPEKSPLSTMLQHGIDTLSNPDLSPRKAAGLAAGFNKGIEDFWDKTEMGLKEATVAMQRERHDAELPGVADRSGILAAGSEAISKAHADFTDTAGDPEAFEARVADRIRGISDPEGWQADRHDATMLQKAKAAGVAIPNVPGIDNERIAFLEQFGQRPEATIPIGEMGPEVLGTDMGDPGAAGVLPPRQGSTKEQRIAAYLQEVNKINEQQNKNQKWEYKTVPRTLPDGREVTQTEVWMNGQPTGLIAGTVSKGRMYASPAEQEQERRTLFDQETQQERITTLGEKEQLAANYVRALELLKGVKPDASYDDIAATRTGVFAELKLKIDRLGSLLGFERSRIKAANAQELYALFGDGVMAQIQKTKGAVSEKEMTYFALISPGLDKEEATNKRILQNQLRFLKREVDIGRLTRKMRYDGKTVVEIERAVGEYYENNRILSDERIKAALREEGYEPDVEYERYRRPGQRPGRRDTSVPSATRQRAQGLGDRLRQYNAPAPQAPAPQAPAPQAATPQAAVEPPLPQGRPPAAALPQGATEQNTLPARRHHTQGFIRSPHVEDALALIDLHKVAEQMGYENWYNIPSGTVIPDRHAPGKFVRIP